MNKSDATPSKILTSGKLQRIVIVLGLISFFNDFAWPKRYSDVMNGRQLPDFATVLLLLSGE